METFRKKARELGCHIKQVEPHSPWQNAAEGAIRELKCGAGRKMMASGAPHNLGVIALNCKSILVLTLPLIFMNYKVKFQKQSCLDRQLTFHLLWSVNGMSLLSGLIQVLSFLDRKNAIGGGLVLLWTLAQL